ncbi:MAG: hypothetical protein Q4A12_08320 [Eubacteriales bacterium]|nr:hypothetical protein [Eubacteriales bacterium]
MKSDKSALVIDTPESCYECKLAIDTCHGTIPNKEWHNKKPTWCPLKPLPKRKLVLEHIKNGSVLNAKEIYEADGWNACLKEITGETE